MSEGAGRGGGGDSDPRRPKRVSAGAGIRPPSHEARRRREARRRIAARRGASRRRALSAALVALLAAACGRAMAQDLRVASPGVLRPGIGAEDPRRPVADRSAAPWRALGRVQTELGTRCTGALVGPRLVLTAAHCLRGRGGAGMVQPGSVHFLLGYHLGSWTAHARVVAFTAGAGFTPHPVRPGPAGADWALLTLERPVAPAEHALALLREPLPPHTPLMLAGYQQDRPEVLLADTDCQALGLERRAAAGQVLLVHDCAGTRGSSGAPVLARGGPDGQWGIAGIAVSVERDNARGRAVPAGAIGPAPDRPR